MSVHTEQQNIEKPLITIVLTTYNSSATIPLVLNAILNQTYPLNRIELVIVDGRSRDATVDIVKEFLQRHGNKFYDVKLIIHDRNYGVSKARNDGLKTARGDYILILDADVVLERNAVELMVQEVSKRREVVLAFLVPSQPSLFDRLKIKAMRKKDCVSLDSFYATNAALIPREVVDKGILFDENMGPPFSIHEDIEYGARLKRNRYRVCKLKNVIAYHLQVEHDAGTLNVVVKEGFRTILKRLISYVVDYGYHWSFYRFLKSLPTLYKVRWLLVALIPIYIILLAIGILTQCRICLSFAVPPLLLTYLVMLYEYFNPRGLLYSLTYSSLKLFIDWLRTVGVTLFLIHNILKQASKTPSV